MRVRPARATQRSYDRGVWAVIPSPIARAATSVRKASVIALIALVTERATELIEAFEHAVETCFCFRQ